jgi:hypothetical protein
MSDCIEHELQGRTLVIAHGPGQSAMARDLMQVVLRSIGGGSPAPGTTIRVGLALLTLEVDAEGRLLLCEPDYLGDALSATRPRVDITLSVLGSQSRLAHAAGIEPAAVGFEQFLVAAPGALAAEAIQLVRAEPTGPEDSGWTLDHLAQASPPDGYEALRVYELVPRRISLLAPLVLPTGVAVVIEGHAIVAVYDANGHQRLAHPFVA